MHFGGEKDWQIDVRPDDVVVLPADTCHQCVTHSVGAYPPSGNLCASKADHGKALGSIPKVPLPRTDPVFRTDGPLLASWRA